MNQPLKQKPRVSQDNYLVVNADNANVDFKGSRFDALKYQELKGGILYKNHYGRLVKQTSVYSQEFLK